MNAHRYWTIAASALAGHAPAADLEPPARDAFAEWACAEGLAGLLLRNASEWTASAGIREALRSGARREAALAALGDAELRRVLRACATSGLWPLLLKGAALAYTVYPAPELRRRRDTDVLIAPADEIRLRAILEELGYAGQPETSGALVTSQFHYLRVDDHGVPHAWDVHLKVSNVHAYANCLTYDEMRHEATALAPLEGALVPSSVHSLLLACIHRVAHHGEDDDLIWLYDLYVLAGFIGPEGWRRVIGLAQAKQLSAVVFRGLDRMCGEFGAVVPDGLMRELRRAARHEPPAPLVGGPSRSVDVLLADLAALPAWRARLQLLREHVFPPRQYMQHLYRGWPQALLPLAYVDRVARGAPKWFRRRRR